jgi:hypothetical protein
MVSLSQKRNMNRFISERFEESKWYNFLECDHSHLLLVQKPELVEFPKEIYIFLHNQKIALADFESSVNFYRRQGRYIGNIFYKDDVNFMVRLAERGNLKGDDRSLKRYTKYLRDRMIHLRGLEKEVLSLQSDSTLVYYQPVTERLAESVRGYELKDVVLDYSHVDREHSAFGFVENRVSVDYKIASELFCLTTGGLKLRKASSNFVIPVQQ